MFGLGLDFRIKGVEEETRTYRMLQGLTSTLFAQCSLYKLTGFVSLGAFMVSHRDLALQKHIQSALQTNATFSCTLFILPRPPHHGGQEVAKRVAASQRSGSVCAASLFSAIQGCGKNRRLSV